ncbi:general transcription factor IIE subunit 2 isoform X1 [Patella vulgata]|uniref:general transcription factor IIE subunit 2 isoform X1 n=1 Tax=Patella vulgata TaxID=6465 RepID=UPI00217F922D|nr:general transcription factor IIE subunit 2 isoform X1 [Patella vulgata]XP_050397718.1 general transcription factor IIE subunit 2 isoform X1 [Patella vulgata]XP_050397720.1 general transcription factor IIE subunit 2 isoform X1 [Patella vulgata]XP_055955346.1 general transcription factor IIE subunit 2 isoform X1 [Patella vulgata]XP_055955347.1 general transcription factor IIE subunit 2 isoform X1 [Patella vulgata]
MDPSLLKEREAFLKRAKNQPSVEKRKHKSKPDTSEPSSKRHKVKSQPPKVPTNFDYKTAHGSSQFKFSVLAKIVKYMKVRHQHGDTHPLMIDEILDETNQTDITTKIKHWLLTEALMNNPKIITKEDREGKRFSFRPKLEIRDRKGLLKLLKNYDLHGRGGINIEDVEEAIPDAEKALKQLGEHVIYVVRPNDKKKILFYNDKYCKISLDEDFQKLWRSVPVEGLDDKKIEEYLEKQGIASMQDVASHKVAPIQKRKKGSRKNKTFKKLNDHLDGLLQDYTENPKK